MRMTESTEDLQSSRMALIESVRQAKNKRTHDKTLEDALAGYDGLVADAYKTRELGLDTQVHRLKNIGRVGTHNFERGLPPNFQDAIWLIEDHEGAQTLRNRVLEGEYGMSLEDEYNPLVKAHNGAMAVLRKEQSDMKLEAQMEQARRTYEHDLGRNEGAD